MSKVRVEVNDNLVMILNYIQSATDPFTFGEFVQWIIDFDLWKEFYMNHAIIVRLYDEKMQALIDLKKREEKGGFNEKKDSINL